MPNFPIIDPIADPILAAALTSAINHKTKPQGSLGMLEILALQLGLIQQTVQPEIRHPAILVFAADHGIVDENISAYPQSVTWQMVENFLCAGAAINVFARQSQCDLRIVDAGVNHVFGARDGLIDCKIGNGTRNFARAAAMTIEQCDAALAHGAAQIGALDGNVVGFGEMGIGNTTAAAALMHALTGIPVAQCVGAGTGLSPQGILHKQQVIDNAMQFHGQSSDALQILRTFGGFEIAMLVGAMLAAAHRRMTLLIDGFIVSSAVLVAARLDPVVLDYCVFSHCSDEHGHQHMLAHLNARPLLQLGMRLGEGTGCALALPLLKAASAFLREMATFESAHVSGKST